MSLIVDHIKASIEFGDAFLSVHILILSAYVHGASDVRPVGLNVGLALSRILGLGTEAHRQQLGLLPEAARRLLTFAETGCRERGMIGKDLKRSKEDRHFMLVVNHELKR